MFYGLDIGGSKIEMAVFDSELNQVWSKRVATPADDYLLLLDTIQTLVEQADSHFSCCGHIGIGIPGLVDHQQGVIYATNLPAVKERMFQHDLQERLARKVKLENDANCFALSEAWSDDARSYPSVLGLILGTGVGGGLVIDGKVFSGRNNNAGEFGHLRLPIDALSILGNDIPLLPCGCGKQGCIESYISGRGFAWLYHHYYQQNLSAPDIISRYRANDANAVAHVERYLSLLAICLGNLFTLLDPYLVVLGGGLSNFDEIYYELPKRLPKHLLVSAKVPEIRKARYGDAGGVRGAAFLNLTD